MREDRRHDRLKNYGYLPKSRHGRSSWSENMYYEAQVRREITSKPLKKTSMPSPDSNRDGDYSPRDFKSAVSTNSTPGPTPQ